MLFTERRLNMDTKDPVVEKTELVIDALQYAHTNSLDINDKEEVKKILEALNAENEDVEEFMKLLQNADAFMDIKKFERESEKTDLPN